MEDLKNLFLTPNRKRKYIFLGIGVFLIILILIIIICVSSSKSKSESKENQDKKEVAPVGSFESYIGTKKYLYVWNYPNADNFIKFIVDHKFSKIFLYVGSIEWDSEKLLNGNLHSAGDIDAKELIKRITEKKIEVELCIYLNDNPDNFENVEKAPLIAQALAKIQKDLKFTALHFDQEPDHPENLEPLLHMYEECRKYIKVSAILKPAWLTLEMSSLENNFQSSDYFKKFKDCETFAEAVVKVSDYSDVMAYSNKYSNIDYFLDIYENILKRHSSHVGAPVLELEPSFEKYSTYARYKEDKKTFFEYLQKVSKRFNGVTIHQYEHWYQDLYCDKAKKDSEYFFGNPKEC